MVLARRNAKDRARKKPGVKSFFLLVPVSVSACVPDLDLYYNGFLGNLIRIWLVTASVLIMALLTSISSSNESGH